MIDRDAVSFVDPAALLLLAAANAVPVIVARILGARLATPIDAAFRMHGERPIFGAHKTWRGIVAGVAAGALVGAALPCGALTGCAFALVALGGDLFSSFVKRRLGRRSGTPVLLLDQLPESLVPLVAFAQPLALTAASIAGTTVCFVVLDVLMTRLRPAPPGTT